MRQRNGIIVGILAFLILATIVFFMVYPFNSRLNRLDFHVFDTNDNYHYEVDEPLEFYVNDTTIVKNKKLIWHFGNGDTIQKNNKVTYTYKEAGRYLITLNVDKTHQISKYIKVISSNEKQAIDSIPKLYGPEEGYVGEELVFSSEGPGIDTWYWEFGESGTVDGYEQQIIYVYSEPGTYEVKLTTNTTEFPIYHKITIFPNFEKIENTVTVDSLSLAQDDIKKHLQAIANANVSDRNSFFRHLNYIQNRYICDNPTSVVVVVNDSKYNDLFSYCQGLHYLDARKNQKMTINQVVLDTFNCVKRINVTQSILE